MQEKMGVSSSVKGRALDSLKSITRSKKWEGSSVSNPSHDDGAEERINLRHTMNPGQIDWFKAGSAMNHMKNLAGG